MYVRCYPCSVISHTRLQIELAVTTHVVVSDIHRNVLKALEGADDQRQSVSEIYKLFHHRMNKQSQPSRVRPGQ